MGFTDAVASTSGQMLVHENEWQLRGSNSRLSTLKGKVWVCSSLQLQWQKLICSSYFILLLWCKSKYRYFSDALTQWVCLAILVRDCEDTNDGVAVLPQLFVDLLAEHTLTNHCNLHPNTSQCSGGITIQGIISEVLFQDYCSGESQTINLILLTDRHDMLSKVQIRQLVLLSVSGLCVCRHFMINLCGILLFLEEITRHSFFLQTCQSLYCISGSKEQTEQLYGVYTMYDSNMRHVYTCSTGWIYLYM